MSDMYTTFDHAGNNPSYVKATHDQRAKPPFSFIGHINGIKLDNTQLEYVGTGWLLHGGLVVTAAHVVENLKAAECIFPDGSKAVFSGPDDIHPRYSEGLEGEYKGSPYDVAVLRPVDYKSNTGLHVSSESLTGTVTAIGYPKAEEAMVIHEGACIFTSNYLQHKAHTNRGHSGCPLLQNNTVVGIHLGGVKFIEEWESDVKLNISDGDNAGLNISDNILTFLQQRIRT